MTQADLGQSVASNGAPACSADVNAVGLHAERLLNLYPSTPAVVSRDEGLMLYRDMTLGRRFEDKCAEMYYRGKMFGFVHLYNGQEAVSTGVIKAMKMQHDWFCSTYRDHVHALSCGVPAREVMSELFGKETGCSKGRGGSMHLFSKEHHLLGGYAFIGEGIPVALGAAFTSRYKRDALGDASSDAVTAAFFGDGTCNIGQFYECLNMAALWTLPVIYACENNGYSEYTRTDEIAAGSITARAEAFGIEAFKVNGQDVLAVNDLAQKLVARCRKGEGPFFIELETYRYHGHHVGDINREYYRTKDEVEEKKNHDPVAAVRQIIIDKSYASEEQLKEIENKVKKTIAEVAEFATTEALPSEDELFTDIFK